MIDYKLIKAILKGTLSYLPGFKYILEQKKTRSKHSGSDSMFCYTLWFRTLNFLKRNNLPLKFDTIAEIGSGGSFGIAFCALLTGSDKYIALEIENNFNSLENLVLFEEILRLFKEDMSVKNPGKDDIINIKCPEYKRYSEVLGNAEFNDALSDSRICLIRNSLKDVNRGNIRILNNWEENISKTDKVDFILSRAVMEHVNDPFSVYGSSNKILNKNGIVLHDVEFHSHGITSEWFKHYNINRVLWFLIRGRRKYYLNRYSLSDHIQFMEANKFIIKDKDITIKEARRGESKIYGAAILALKG
jgi:hypothetical protein